MSAPPHRPTRSQRTGPPAVGAGAMWPGRRDGAGEGPVGAGRSLRVATTAQLAPSVRAAGFEAFVLPELASLSFHRSLQARLSDGAVYRPFFEANGIELVLDFNTEALTLTAAASDRGADAGAGSDARAGATEVCLTTAALGIPYVACYLDPITSTMGQVAWGDHWGLLESNAWIKWIWESAHAEELQRMGVTNVLTLPMAVVDDDFDTSPPPDPDPGPVIAFMGHPATTWFQSTQPVLPRQLFAGLVGAAVHADMPDVAFHKIYFDLYGLGDAPMAGDAPQVRAAKARRYFDDKFVYNAYLAVRQRDRWARFLQHKLSDRFELIGDHWHDVYGLRHTPRVWDMRKLHERMRRVPICLNLMKGCLETGLNVRHFEITAHGGFMLTYPTDELASCFVIGKECDVFHDESELLEKTAYYLDHAAERREIAAAGQRRTLSEHLYSHRIARIVEVLRGARWLPAAREASDGAGRDVQVVAGADGACAPPGPHGVSA